MNSLQSQRVQQRQEVYPVMEMEGWITGFRRSTLLPSPQLQRLDIVYLHCVLKKTIAISLLVTRLSIRLSFDLSISVHLVSFSRKPVSNLFLITFFSDILLDMTAKEV